MDTTKLMQLINDLIDADRASIKQVDLDITKEWYNGRISAFSLVLAFLVCSWGSNGSN